MRRTSIESHMSNVHESDDDGTVSQRIARFMCDFGLDDIDPPVVEKTKDHIAHLLAGAFAGFSTVEGSHGRDVGARLGGAGPCTVIGSAAPAMALDAAFANSAMMWAHGLDDALMPAGVHPGLVVLPAALAIGEQERRSGADVITAIVLGYEVLGKIGGLLWCYESRTPQRATIPFGAFGPAAAAAKLLRLPPDQAANAIGYAACSAMGLSENPFFDYSYALAARNGITAATIAAAGGSTASTILEGTHGFFQSTFGMIPPDLDDMVGRLGDDLELARAQVKHYLTTGMNHEAIRLMREVTASHGLTPDNVTAITLRISKRRENHQIGHFNGQLTSRWQAVSSAPFNLAVVLVEGDVDPARYDDYADPVLTAIRSKTTVELVEHENPLFVQLEVTDTEGRRHHRTAEEWSPLPDVPRLAKLRQHGDRLLGEDKIARLDELLTNLEAVDDVGELMACLRGSDLAESERP